MRYGHYIQNLWKLEFVHGLVDSIFIRHAVTRINVILQL